MASSSKIPKNSNTTPGPNTNRECGILEDPKMLLSFDVASSLFQNEFNEKMPNENEYPNKVVNTKSNTDVISECCRDDLSQFYESSQVLRQLDTVIDHFDRDEKNNTDKCLSCKSPKRLKKKIHELKQDTCAWDITATSEIFRLFESSQYKKDVSKGFNNLETTICEIGEGQDKNLRRQNNPSSSVVVQDANKANWTSVSIESHLKRFNTQVAVNEQIKNMQQQQQQQHNGFVKLGPFYELPLKVKELIQEYKGIDSLYDWQDECLNLSAIKNRKNLVYALPTSGGKTLVSEILIFREILCRKKNVLFVLPYVSIVQEKVWALSPFALGLDFLVEEYAAGKGGYPPRKRRYKKSVYIATIEKALALVNSLLELNRLNEIGLVVVDELHLVGEPGRGATLETLLTKIIHAKENIQIVGMSATIGNLPEICKFLKAEVYSKDFRPVELKEFIKCGSEIFQIDRNAISDEDRLIPIRTLNFQYSSEIIKIDPDRLTGLVMEVVPNGSCLVFCASKKNCENVAKLLCRVMFRTLLEHRKKEKENLICGLLNEGALCPILRHTIPFGVAYHHSGLTADERQIIENAFRNGVLCCICCTSTLAAGVNLPARRVILRSPYIGREFISLSKYKQMSGRAGRAGLGEIGESILVCDQRDLKRVVGLLCSPMEHVESRLHEDNARGLRNMILSCIALGTATSRRNLREITACTLFAVQEEKLHITVKKATDNVISDLFKLGALQLATDTTSLPDRNISVLLQQTLASSPLEMKLNSEEKKKTQIVINSDSRLVISKLGRAAIKGGLDLDTAHVLYEDLVQAQASLVLFTCLHLLYLVTPYDLVHQIQPSLPNYYSIYVELGLKELQTAKILGLNEACGASMLTGRKIKSVSERVLNRFYLTLVLYDLWNGKNVFQVANKYQVSRGIVQQLMVSAATFTSNVVRFCEELDEFWYFAYLLRGMGLKLQHCTTRELEPLMELPSVKMARARQLFQAGYKTLQSIARENPQVLVNTIEHMSYRVANQLIASAKLLLLERVENLREEAEDVLEGINSQIQ